MGAADVRMETVMTGKWVAIIIVALLLGVGGVGLDLFYLRPQLARTRADLQQQLINYKKLLDQTIQTQQDLRDALLDAQNVIGGLESQGQEFARQLTADENARKALESRVQELKTQQDNLTQRFNDSETARMALEDRITDVENQRDQLRLEYEKTVRSQKNIQGRLAVLEGTALEPNRPVQPIIAPVVYYRDPADINKALDNLVTLKITPKAEPTVQQAVQNVLKQVGVEYNWVRSYANTNPVCMRKVTVDLAKVPCREALDKILTPFSLAYDIASGQVVLKH
jgi:hypothetical protein